MDRPDWLHGYPRTTFELFALVPGMLIAHIVDDEEGRDALVERYLEGVRWGDGIQDDTADLPRPHEAVAVRALVLMLMQTAEIVERALEPTGEDPVEHLRNLAAVMAQIVDGEGRLLETDENGEA